MAAARELQVQIANEPGALGTISEILGEHGINIEGFGVWVATAHILTSDPDTAAVLLREEGFQLHVADVLKLVVPDEPGNLAEIARALGEAGMNIDYSYTVSTPTPGAAGFILAVANTGQAERVLD
ncbi:MAG: hypothetical protein GKS06_10220 [Acidobacteria bacterium]|nr:hypothetical protein [Acidobacteriota bacterium]